MAIKKCEKCKEYYGKKNKFCTKCGYKNDTVEKEINIKLIAGLLTIGIIIALFFGVKYFFSPQSSNTIDNSTYKQLSYNYAREYVKNRLKSPSSATFPSLFNRQGHITKVTNTEYRINSWVESQNSFGAKIKTRFTCQINIKNGVVSLTYLKIYD